MTNTYFKNVNTLEELRRQYRDLLKKFHPDCPGGSTEATQQINAEYEQLFKLLKGKHESTQSAGTNESKTSNESMRWDETEDELLREMISKVIHFDSITIELCGTWIWISGNTYQCRKELKALGFKWASQKKQWYWHSETYRKKSHKTLSMDAIRNYYGSTEVKTEARLRLAEA